tara:strand:- start:1649 stop:1897 length:249 start_codon:yes stop_codon:yes gene_type:complete
MKELKDAVKDKQLIFGTKQTLKLVKLGKAKVVFVATDCPAEVREDILKFANLAGTKVLETDITSQEVGSICKKAFSINVLCY